MDSLIYNAITNYYSILKKLGYYKYSDVFRLLLLCFYRDFVYNDYRGIISREDYKEIEKALNCLFGTNCLIPYPDYLKMGKLHIGEVTEFAQRMKNIEETVVLKAKPVIDTEGSDIIIIDDKDL